MTTTPEILCIGMALVDTGAIVRSAEHPTPVTTMFVREDGSRQSITNRAHRYNFHPERYTARFAGVRAVLLGSLFRAPFDDPTVVHAVLSAAIPWARRGRRPVRKSEGKPLSALDRGFSLC